MARCERWPNARRWQRQIVVDARLPAGKFVVDGAATIRQAMVGMAALADP